MTSVCPASIGEQAIVRVGRMHQPVQSAVCDRMSSVCLSVHPSVTLVNCDHIGWNSSEIISLLVSLWCSLSADPNIRGLLYSKENTRKFWPKVTQPLLIWALETLDRKCGRMVTDSATVTMESYIGNHNRSFEWCYRWPPTTPLPPKMGVPYTWKIRGWPYLRNGSFDPLI